MDSFSLDSDDDPMDGFFMDQGPDISQIMKDFGINTDEEISADEDENPKPKSLSPYRLYILLGMVIDLNLS